MRTRGMLAATFGAMALGSGCSGDVSEAPVAPVWGKVTVDGKPMRGGYVIFIPDGSQGNDGLPARGIVRAEGFYPWLSTYRDKDGARVGWHRVVVHMFDSPAEGSPELLPARYNTRTELRRYVEPGKQNRIDLDLTTRR